LNIHGLNDVRQTALLTAQTPVPETSAFEVQLAIGKLKVRNHQVLITSHQNLLRQGVSQFAVRSLTLLFQFGIRRNFLKSGRN
jgi:hypothetical protein